MPIKMHEMQVSAKFKKLSCDSLAELKDMAGDTALSFWQGGDDLEKCISRYVLTPFEEEFYREVFNWALAAWKKKYGDPCPWGDTIGQLFRYDYPLDPDCPEVKEYEDSMDDPYAEMAGEGEDTRTVYGNSHRKTCKRCQEYGAANVDVDERK